jgi:hypothetical protein
MCMRLELKDCLLGEGQTFERECWILLILLKKQIQKPSQTRHQWHQTQKPSQTRHQWLTPVILASQKAEIGRIAV